VIVVIIYVRKVSISDLNSVVVVDRWSLTFEIRPCQTVFSIGCFTWASADFFPGELGGQDFPGGQKHAICLKKTPKNILFSLKKSKNIPFSTARTEGGGEQGPLLALPC